MLYLRNLLVAVGVTVALSGCSFDQILGRGGSEATPAAGSAVSGTASAGADASVPRERALKAASEAVGAEVVVKPGQYLLCRTTDEYKGRTTAYYVCRERRCFGQESPATGVGTLKNKSSCLSACRKSETKKGRDASQRAYCVG